MIIWLGLVELAWIGYWLLGGSHDPIGRMTTVAWIGAMIGWLIIAVRLGRQEFFLRHSHQLSNLGGVALVVTFGVGFFGAVPAAREAVLTAVAGVPDQQLVAFHAMRILAIGTVVKYVQGHLPLHFIVLGSTPDLVFAVSAIALLVLHTAVSPEFLLVWHIVGSLVFFGAGISMFFSVPSPLRIFHSQPDTRIVFTFPMVLAPNFTVPLFILAHLFAVAKLVVR